MGKEARYRKRKYGEMPDMTGCIGCQWYAPSRENRCGYFFDTGYLRLSSPEDCTVREKKTRKRRALL